MRRSKIEWTDYSGGYANIVWRGSEPTDCKCSPGCANCYVDRITARAGDRWPHLTQFHPDKLEKLARCQPRPGDTPYRRGPGSKPMVFVGDIGDLFHRRVPQWFIHKALDTFYARNDITWQLLTKRPERMYDEIEAWLAINALGELPDWIWAGVTVENQDCAAERISPFSALRAAVRWVSYEPALDDIYWAGWEFIDWLVVGGESGTDARPMSPAWVHHAKEFVFENGVAFFFKQWGEWAPTDPTSCFMKRVGRQKAGCLFEGREYKEFPL